ncbi:hypothetical protein D9M70_558310 [compost metagenome]
MVSKESDFIVSPYVLGGAAGRGFPDRLPHWHCRRHAGFAHWAAHVDSCQQRLTAFDPSPGTVAASPMPEAPRSGVNRDAARRAMDQSAYWPAASITGFQRAISLSSFAFSAAGVASASEEGSVPSSPKRATTFGSLSATCSDFDRRSVTSAGVPFGA